MKTLKKIQLNAAKEMTPAQMKAVTGGNYGSIHCNDGTVLEVPWCNGYFNYACDSHGGTQNCNTGGEWY